MAHSLEVMYGDSTGTPCLRHNGEELCRSIKSTPESPDDWVVIARWIPEKDHKGVKAFSHDVYVNLVCITIIRLHHEIEELKKRNELDGQFRAKKTKETMEAFAKSLEKQNEDRTDDGKVS